MYRSWKIFSRLGPLRSNRENVNCPLCSVAVKKAMDAKLCLCLMLIILGTLTVQGAIPRNKKNPSEVFARQLRKCFFDPLMSTFYSLFSTA